MNTSLQLADSLHILGYPVRVQIVLILAREEACVCHIEAVLGIRQALISQNLMALRAAGWVAARREGRNIFYRLANAEIYPAVCHLAEAAGIAVEDFAAFAAHPVQNCPCPACNPTLDPELTCQKIKAGKKDCQQE